MGSPSWYVINQPTNQLKSPTLTGTGNEQYDDDDDDET